MNKFNKKSIKPILLILALLLIGFVLWKEYFQKPANTGSGDFENYPTNGSETNWQTVKQAIADCQVKSIMQTHSLEVRAVLKNGTILTAQEPKIDDVFDVVAENKENCGEIIMATE